MNTCKICNSEFKGARSDTPTCSPECKKQHQKNREAAYREANREALRARGKIWREDPANKEKIQANLVKFKGRHRQLEQVRRYNVSEEEAELLLSINHCEICGLEGDGTRYGAITTDHCHETGMIRGRLCHNHNRGLGLLGDDIEILKKCIEYLEKGNFFDRQ